MGSQPQDTGRIRRIKRRSLLGGGLAGGLLLRSVLGTALADPATPLVRRTIQSPPNTFFAYPHCNAFLDDDRCVVIRETSEGGKPGREYMTWHLSTGASEFLLSVPDTRGGYSISNNGLMMQLQRHGVALVDLTQKDKKVQTLCDFPDWYLSAVGGISPDGKSITFTRSHHSTPEEYQADLLDVASGGVTTIASVGFQTDHAQFSPYDPAWLCYCDGTDHTRHRLWVWNKQASPVAKTVFNQTTPDGKVFLVGHERAMFNKAALLVVVYGASSAVPRGLYEVGFDGSVRLVSESDRDFHCNISHDGHWAVVSLQGAATADDGKLDLRTRAAPMWMRGEGGYGYSDVDIVNMRTGARQFLYRGTNATKGQPYEVQPAISPDGRWVLLKDARAQRVIALEIDQDRLAAFLNA